MSNQERQESIDRARQAMLPHMLKAHAELVAAGDTRAAEYVDRVGFSMFSSNWLGMPTFRQLLKSRR